MQASIVIFELGGHRLALPAACVRECLPLPELWRRPGSPAAVAGFFSLGGAVLPVVDLAVLMGLRSADGGGGLEQDGLYRPLLHVGDAALLVDRLDRVAQPDPAAPETPEAFIVPEALDPPKAPGADGWQHGCVARHLVVDGVPVALLDPARILLDAERDRLHALAHDAARRAGLWSADAASDHAR